MNIKPIVIRRKKVKNRAKIKEKEIKNTTEKKTKILRTDTLRRF